jgi:hypothetical protein
MGALPPPGAESTPLEELTGIARARRIIAERDDPIEQAILAILFLCRNQAHKFEKFTLGREASSYVEVAFPQWRDHGLPWEAKLMAPWFARRAAAAGLAPAEVTWRSDRWEPASRRHRDGRLVFDETTELGWMFPAGSNEGVRSHPDAFVFPDGRFEPASSPGFRTRAVVEMADILGMLPGDAGVPARSWGHT